MKYRIPSWTLAMLSCLLWSTAFVGVKYAILFAPPLFVAGVRFFIAGLILIPFAGKGFIKEFIKHFRIIILTGFMQTFCVYLFFFLSLARIKASTGAALVGLGPMAGAILGHIFIKADKFTLKKILSFVLGLIGVTLVSLSGGKNGGLPDIAETAGIIMFILNILAGAFSNVFVLKYKSSIRSSVLTSSQLLLGGVMLFILSLFTYKDITFILPGRFYLSLLWLVFVSSAGFSMWYYLLAKRRENLIDMNIWKFIMPVTGGILSWIIIPDDSPNPGSITGMIIVAISIYIFYFKKRVSPPSL